MNKLKRSGVNWVRRALYSLSLYRLNVCGDHWSTFDSMNQKRMLDSKMVTIRMVNHINQSPFVEIIFKGSYCNVAKKAHFFFIEWNVFKVLFCILNKEKPAHKHFLYDLLNGSIAHSSCIASLYFCQRQRKWMRTAYIKPNLSKAKQRREKK